MTKTPTAKRKSKGKKLSTPLVVTIVVATIGCVGTVLAALITGVFTYLNSGNAPDFSSSEISPSVDWQGIMSITDNSPCPTLYYPENLFSGSDKVTWLQENAPKYHTPDQLMYAPSVDNPNTDKGNEVQIFMTISSIVDSDEWIRLAKDARISVRRIDDAPEISDVVVNAECGGAAFYRYFSPVSLRSDHDQYEDAAISNDADYYTLQPGEPEIFAFTFVCDAPGIYVVSAIIPFTYQDVDSEVVYSDASGIACPSKFTYYKASIIQGIAEAFVVGVDNYEWNGSAYEMTGP